jgi:hypothetical protein
MTRRRCVSFASTGEENLHSPLKTRLPYEASGPSDYALGGAVGFDASGGSIDEPPCGGPRVCPGARVRDVPVDLFDHRTQRACQGCARRGWRTCVSRAWRSFRIPCTSAWIACVLSSRTLTRCSRELPFETTTAGGGSLATGIGGAVFQAGAGTEGATTVTADAAGTLVAHMPPLGQHGAPGAQAGGQHCDSQP